MNDALAWEQRLIAATDDVELTRADLTEVAHRLHAWLAELTQDLVEHRIPIPKPLRGTHALARQVERLDDLLMSSAEIWKRQWAALAPAQQLAQVFEDKIILLLFGKFNAGKSSLCNLLADRFAAHTRAVQYFYLASGRIVETARRLDEGATETTACLQGVCIGARMVLLDTPGLHSVTAENAALTQRFTDSADAVLWLTSSTSPGQVQELDELARELHRQKPLLPIITRSDVIEEDEVGHEIVKLLRNKTPTNRKLQEADVQARARDKLLQMGIDDGLLKNPVSVSAYMAREQGQTGQALTDGGFAYLYTALLDIVESARAYKRRKPAEVLLHHLDENVLGAVHTSFEPALSQLVGLLSQEREGLKQLRPRLASTAWRQVAPELPRMLEQHAPTRDVARLCSEVDDLVCETLAHQVEQQLCDYDLSLLEHGERSHIELPAHVGYEVLFEGDGKGSADMAFDATAAADSTSTLTIDIGHERLHGVLQEAIQLQVSRQLDKVFAQCGQALDRMQASANTLQEFLALQDGRLQQIKRRLRGAIE